MHQPAVGRDRHLVAQQDHNGVLRGTRAALQHPAAVDAVAYLPDGRSLVTACRDGRLRVWDMTAIKPVVRYTVRVAGGDIWVGERLH